MSALVSVTIVTTNDGRHIRRCVDSLFAQDYGPMEIIFVDNASTDGTRELLGSLSARVRVHWNNTVQGFCAAQNQAIALAKGEWILCLNPDTQLEPNFVTELVRAGELHPRIGMVCPKILRMTAEGAVADPPLLDSTGAYFTPWLRHHDRGSQQPDLGQFDRPEYVFGYTGAAVLFRRSMIEDASIDGEFMDEDFFFYREDADVSWRAQLLGWKCVYTPKAVGYHVRRVLETNRQTLSAKINMHSTKNRFLMRIKNMTWGVYGKVFWPATFRDLAIFSYVLLRERSSLPGLWFIPRNWKRTWAKRRWIQARRCVGDEYVRSWFNYNPTAAPLETEFAGKLEDINSRSGVLSSHQT